MFETYAATAGEVDVYRAVTPFDLPESASEWALGPVRALKDATTATSGDDHALLLHGVAAIADLRDIDVVEEWATIEPDRVRVIERIPLEPPVDGLRFLLERLAQIRGEDDDER